MAAVFLISSTSEYFPVPNAFGIGIFGIAILLISTETESIDFKGINKDALNQNPDKNIRANIKKEV